MSGQSGRARQTGGTPQVEATETATATDSQQQQQQQQRQSQQQQQHGQSSSSSCYQKRQQAGLVICQTRPRVRATFNNKLKPSLNSLFLDPAFKDTKGL